MIYYAYSPGVSSPACEYCGMPVAYGHSPQCRYFSTSKTAMLYKHEKSFDEIMEEVLEERKEAWDKLVDL